MKIELTKTQVVNEEKGVPKKLWPFIVIFLRRHPLSLLVFSLFVFFEVVMAINLRRTVRAIVFNKKHEILLMHVMGGPTKKNDQSFWCTLGGRIEKNETIEETLKRELREEAGVTDLEDYQLIAFGEQVLKWNNFPTRLIEKFYAVHVESVQLHATNLTEEESEIIKAYRWWDISDLSNTHEIIYPGCLAMLADEYINKNGILWTAREIDLD